MGGQDLLPPAKAGGARRSSRSTLKVTALISTTIIVILLYATQHTHPPPTPPPSATSDAIVVPAQHPETAAPVSSSPPPSPQPVAAAAAAAEAAVVAVASPSVISLNLKAGSGGKEHTLRLRLLPEHSGPSVEFMRCAAMLKRLASPCTCTAHARHITHARHVTAHARHGTTHGTRQCGRRVAPHSAATPSSQVCRHPPVRWRAVPLREGLSRARPYQLRWQRCCAAARRQGRLPRRGLARREAGLPRARPELRLPRADHE